MLTYNSLGGTGKEAVIATMGRLHAELVEKKAVLAADQKRVAASRANCRSIASAAANVKNLKDLQSLVKKFA